MNSNFDIQQLEQLALAYFECSLSRAEEEALKKVLASTAMSSPIINECRAVMGVTAVLRAENKPTRRIAPAVKRFNKKYWLSAAASLAILLTAGAILLFSNIRLDQPTTATTDDGVYAVAYCNGHRLSDEQARQRGEALLNECLKKSDLAFAHADLMFDQMDSQFDDIDDDE
jgi:hypothetical protein